MAAADTGFRTPQHRGTTSTASAAGQSVLAGGHAPDAIDRVHFTRAHRMRTTAWILAVTSVLLLLAGLGALFSASSPGPRSDAEASANLITSFRRATDSPGYRQGVAISSVERDAPSNAPNEVSVDQTSALWFGAVRSTSGHCFLLAVRLSDGQRGAGTLGRDEPCTATQVRLRSEKRLVDASR